MDNKKCASMPPKPDSQALRKCQTVRVSVDVHPDRPLTGRVTNIGLRADNAFNYDFEIEITNPGGELRAGMHAKALFAFPARRSGLTLPRRAIAGSIQDAKVYVVQDSVAVLRTIELGEQRGDKVEVRSGLNARDRVVVAGQINLSDGARVQVVKVVGGDL